MEITVVDLCCGERIRSNEFDLLLAELTGDILLGGGKEGMRITLITNGE